MGTEELHKIWSKYLDTASSADGDMWLNIFLSKFIQAACQEDSAEKLNELSSGWRNASNTLAHHLIFNMYQICNNMTAVLESSDSVSSAPLQKYLLNGQGWKLLWTLEIMGLQNLTCTKGLVNLLIAHMPVVLSFVVSPSNVSDAILRKYPGESTVLPDFATNDNADVAVRSKSSKRHHFVTAKKIHLRQRTAKEKAKTVQSDGSSSDNDMYISPKLWTFSLANRQSLHKNDYQEEDAESGSEVFVDCNENEDELSLKLLLSVLEYREFQEFSLSVVSYVKYVVYFLEKIVQNERKNWLTSLSASQPIADFALKSLKDFQSDETTLEGWSSSDVKNLRNHFLRLMIQSTLVVENFKGVPHEVDIIEILQLLLRTISSIVTQHKSNETFSTEDAQFMVDTIIGILTFISHIIQTSSSDLAKIICAIRTFSSYDGIALFCSAITYLEQTCSFNSQISSVANHVKNVILLLKQLRSHNTQSPILKSDDPSINPHHHSDILGSMFSHSIMYAEPICCVATMCHLLLKLYKSLNSKHTIKIVLKMIQEAGICCCIGPNFVMNILLNDFENYGCDHQQHILIALEKTIYPQLGFAPTEASMCSVCLERQKENNNLNEPVKRAYMDATCTSKELFAQQTSDSTKWQCMNIYCKLLYMQNKQSITLIKRHLNFLFTSASTCVMKEVFVRVIFPNLMKLVFELRKGNELLEEDSDRMVSFLMLLPCLLRNFAVATVFIQFGGMRMLCDIIGFPQFCSIGLKSLKILILMEVRAQKSNMDGAALYVSETSFSSWSSIIIFVEVMLNYSKLFLTDIRKISANGTGKVSLSSSLIHTDDDDISKSFESSLIFLCGLWSVCNDIALKIPASAMYINNNVVMNSYDLFITLLENSKMFSDLKNVETFHNYLHLVKHLLTLILHYEARNVIQSFPKKSFILKNIKSAIFEHEPPHPIDFEALLEILLQCSYQNTEESEESFVSSGKVSSDNSVSTSIFNDSASSSDSDECDSLDSSYDGDTERSDSELSEGPYSWFHPPLCEKIKHGDLVKLVLEIIAFFVKSFSSDHWLHLAEKILRCIISLSQHGQTNIDVLCDQDICSYLLEGFSEVLKTSSTKFEELQNIIMDLFAIISPQTITPVDLRNFITLCKSSTAPFGMLVKTLNSIVDSTSVWPYHAISFPCLQKRLRIPKNENMKKYDSLMRLYCTYFKRCSMNELACAWNCTASIATLPVDAKWFVLKKEFSLVLWLMVEEFRNEGISTDEKLVLEEKNSCHIMSLGSNAVLLELWVDRKLGDLIFKIHAYHDGNVYLFAQETCKGIFKRQIWQHLVLDFKETREKKKVSCKIQVLIDGCEQHSVAMSYVDPQFQIDSSYFVLIGHSVPQSDYNTDNPKWYHISSLAIFKGDTITRDIGFYLANLGPTVTNTSKCLLSGSKMFFPQDITSKVLNCGLDGNMLSGLSIPSLEGLQKNILFMYSAENSNICALYPQPTRIIFPLLAPFSAAGNFSIISQNECPSQQEPELLKLLFTSHQQLVERKSIYAAMHHVGGIPVFMLLFARVMECSTDLELQADSLRLLLKMVTKNRKSSDYFLKISGDHILRMLLTSKKCILSLPMLKVLLDNCLSGKALSLNESNQWEVDVRTKAILTRPLFWSVLVKSVFHSDCHNEDVQLFLIRVVKVLLQSTHPHQKFNAQQMRAVQMLETLLFVLKDYYILGDCELPLEIAKEIPSVVQKLLSKPIDFRQIWLICDFLLLLHQTSNTYVCHAKSSFYFLFPNQIQGKKPQKDLVLFDSTSDEACSGTESAKELSLTATDSSQNQHLRNVKSMPNMNIFESNLPQLQRMSSKVVASTDNDDSFVADLKKIVRIRGDPELIDSGIITGLSTATIEPIETIKQKDMFDSIEERLIEETEKKPEPAETDLDRTEINLGLLCLVKDIIIESDESAKVLILDIVRPEVLIVLAYNPNVQIAHSALEILQVYLQCASEEKIKDFLSIKGFHLLANQMHQMPADPLIIGAFFTLMFFGTHAAEDLTKCNLSESVANTLRIMSAIPLLSLLPNTSTNLGVCNSILSAINNLLTEVPNAISELTYNGFCESLAHLILRIYHSQSRTDCTIPAKNSTGTEKDIVITSIFGILRVMSSSLFSSKDAADFDAFASLLLMFCNFEIQCYYNCSSKDCVQCWRDCQCVMYQAALDFIQLYNYTQLKDDYRTNLEDVALWEMFKASMQDSLYPYSGGIVSSFGGSGPKPSLLDSHCTLQDVERATKELPMTDASDRFRYILDKASDFVIFRDAKSNVRPKERSLFKSLYHSIVRGMSIFKEISGSNKKTRWQAVVFPAKESLRQQLCRLLIAVLALEGDIEQKMFTLELLVKEFNFAEVMSMVFYHVSKMEALHMFLCDMMHEEVLHTWPAKNIFQAVYDQVDEMLEDTGVKVPGDEVSVKTYIKDWKKMWLNDQQIWLREQKSAPRKLEKKLDKLSKQISEIAMDVTKRVVDLQSIERKKFMEEVKLKNSEEVSTRDIWRSLLEQLTHERAIWHMAEAYANSWEIDPTEGPQRIRKRLRRCYLDIDPKFVLPEYREFIRPKDRKIALVDLIEHRLSDSSLVINKLHANEKIEFSCPCKVVTTFEEAKGELLLGDTFLHFIGEETRRKQKIVSERWSFCFIKEILLRRFELQNSAFEIFMKNGLTFLVAFYSTKDLETVWKRLDVHKLPCITEGDVQSLTQLWRDRTITNFEYLTHVNKFAGRSFNDLMQYPVFPFVLANYASDVLDLTDSSSFRILARPVAVQNKNREEYYIRAYNCLKDDFTSPYYATETPISGPYHYGSHYSNSGTILHFLVRLLPYTYSLIHYQDNSFDIPDRTFHSVDTSWQLVTKNSTSDVKELIPEFFFLPEFLRNPNGFNFGKRQCGTQVSDVILPPWCRNNSRFFVLVHRQALESPFVTNALNNWIDLVFGYKQTGTAAINAINVFHPATYFGMDISKLEDPITRQALYAMIKTVGQMPKQLFSHPHPMVSLSLSTSVDSNQKEDMIVLDCIKGLKWGNYVGSPSTPKPNLIWRCKQPIPVGTLLSIFTNDVFGLQQNVCLLLNHSRDKSPSISTATYIRSAALISWGYDDGIVRIKFCRDHPPVPLVNGNSVDPVCLCASVPDCNELFIAHNSGTIFVYNCDVDSSKFVMKENRLPIQLTGHSAAVTSICICKAFSIVVTASEDKSCIIWDLNKLSYVRSIYAHKSCVKLVCVSDTLGDIASVSHKEEGSCLKTHTINGELIGSVDIADVVTAICYSTAPEGISVNVIAAGTATGSISFWSSWDLRPLREIKEEKFLRPVICMTFSIDNEHLYAANVDGTVAVWEKPSKMLMNMPRFLLFT